MSGFADRRSIYEINLRTLLGGLSREIGRSASLDDIPPDTWRQLAESGFAWVWLLGVWQTGAAGREASRALAGSLQEYSEALPDVTESDICGSPFAISNYSVNAEYGGAAALERTREQLRAHGLRLILDFVPNHTALDHPWVRNHPEYYVRGTESDLQQQRANYCRIETAVGPQIFAHGRDPYFPGWADTLQLDYSNPDLQAAMKAELQRIASSCDGVRCDMAMLLLPDVFRQTWHLESVDFWKDAIDSVRRQFPDFLFMAEVYWGREWDLQQLGFDATYDKTLYDRVCRRDPGAIRDHLRSPIQFQNKSVRFLENHDEQRAAAVLPLEIYKPAAIITYLNPGFQLFEGGQMEGRRRKASMHLCRQATEAVDVEISSFYAQLLECMAAIREGNWRLLDATPAWPDNWTWSCFVAWAWQRDASTFLAVVNFAPNQSQCYLRLPFPEINNRAVHLRDRLGPYNYDRDGSALYSHGLYLDMPAWSFHFFDVG